MPRSRRKKIEQLEAEEIERLMEQYKTLPPKRMAVAHGLIVQAARLRVRLNYLWEDLEKKGEVELFQQSKDEKPYERERPSSRIFTATDKSYQSIIKQLNDMVPEDVEDDAGFDCE